MFEFLKSKSSASTPSQTSLQSEASSASSTKTVAPMSPKSVHPMEVHFKNMRLAVLKIGEVVEARCIGREGSRVYFDLGKTGIGIIYGQEFFEAQDVLKHLKEGETISAKVVELDNEDGYIELSLKEAGLEKAWQELRRLMQTGESFQLKVLDANRGGLILEKEGLRGFLPVSQLSPKHYPRVDGGEKEKIFSELRKFISETLEVKVIDVNPKEAKLIFSERGAQSGEIAKIMEKFKIGEIAQGEVSGVVDFGVFIKLEEGIEGLAHISELSWNLVEDPRALFKQGDIIKVKIIGIEGDKISLSVKALETDPWLKVEEKYKKGDIAEGKVTKLNPYGAFVQLEEGIHGLSHISEFGSQAKMADILHVGQTYQFKITFLDVKDHRLSLSLVGVGKEEPAPSEGEGTPLFDIKRSIGPEDRRDVLDYHP